MSAACERGDHDWVYQQKLPDHPTMSAPAPRDNGNTNVRTCRACKVQEHKAWLGPTGTNNEA